MTNAATQPNPSPDSAAPATAASRWRDGVRLGMGTFTAIAVPPPQHVDTRRWAIALTIAPAAGAVVGVAVALTGIVAWWLAGVSDNQRGVTATLAGVLAVVCYAVLTRGLHLDGLADTADGVASATTGERALAVMRDPALGALGGLTLMVIVLAQAISYGALVSGGSGAGEGAILAGPAAVVAVVVAVLVMARAPLPWLTRAGTPTAEGGLGRSAIGAMTTGPALLVGAWWTTWSAAGLALAGVSLPAVAVCVLAQWGSAAAVRRGSLRRFGVINGDVLGGAVELAGTSALVILALVW